jgi:hypothetical protein
VLFRRQVDDLIAEEAMPMPGTGPVTIGVEARPGAYTFEVVVDGQCTIIGHGSARLLSAEAAEWFLSARFALMAIGSTGTAAFTDVHSSVLSPNPQVIVPHFAQDL